MKLCKCFTGGDLDWPGTLMKFDMTGLRNEKKIKSKRIAFGNKEHTKSLKSETEFD